MEEKIYPASGFDFKKRPLSYSTMKLMLKSPLHFSHNWFEKKVKSEAFVLGSLVDILLFSELQGLEVEDQIFVLPELNLRTKEGRETKGKLLEANEDKLLVTQEQIDQAELMVESVKNCPQTKWLYDSIIEVQKRITFTDKTTGLPVVMYLDAISKIGDRHIIWDLKTAISADHDEFSKAAAKFDYPLQAAIYTKGYHRKTFSFPEFFYVVVEKTPPYAANSIKADAKYMEIGKELMRKCLANVKFCQEHDMFDMGYEFLNVMGHDIISVPYWYKAKHG